jgi:hypothetical protein
VLDETSIGSGSLPQSSRRNVTSGAVCANAIDVKRYTARAPAVLAERRMIIGNFMAFSEMWDCAIVTGLAREPSEPARREHSGYRMIVAPVKTRGRALQVGSYAFRADESYGAGKLGRRRLPHDPVGSSQRILTEAQGKMQAGS